MANNIHRYRVWLADGLEHEGVWVWAEDEEEAGLIAAMNTDLLDAIEPDFEEDEFPNFAEMLCRLEGGAIVPVNVATSNKHPLRNAPADIIAWAA